MAVWHTYKQLTYPASIKLNVIPHKATSESGILQNLQINSSKRIAFKDEEHTHKGVSEKACMHT
jgi:hypothetical protein